MTTNIPFDVEKWKSGKYDVVTRDGHEKILSLLIHNVDILYPVSGLREGYCAPDTYTINGICEVDFENNYDLFLIPKKRKVWIAVDKKITVGDENKNYYFSSMAYKTKEDLLNTGVSVNMNHIIEVELPE